MPQATLIASSSWSGIPAGNDSAKCQPSAFATRASVSMGDSRRPPPDIKGIGYVVDALEAALWAFHRSEEFREGALLAVNLGDDADTTGAIYGQLAGAHYGAESIPAPWRAKLTMAAEITSLADQLHDQAALAS